METQIESEYSKKKFLSRENSGGFQIKRKRAFFMKNSGKSKKKLSKI